MIPIFYILKVPCERGENGFPGRFGFGLKRYHGNLKACDFTLKPFYACKENPLAFLTLTNQCMLGTKIPGLQMQNNAKLRFETIAAR